ncbi:glycoside hydrolase family 32 protein [Pedobacter nyackensis]|uniref:beta-fructofuranosidase n=1 Tax=Pedobacter nyackensis TaxID=475255 RepID=A0A1W2F3S2_9SPHI|nr:glycoside hydrolase family 32 protein [Pedobacter nyackensis]SMD16148.1 beta-fructofuranosidase [Pedobacter nyackensis]
MIFKRFFIASVLIIVLLACSKEKVFGPAEPFKEETFNIFPKPTLSANEGAGQQTGWVGDVMPYFANGQFEIFFLHDAPDRVKQSSSGQHPIHKFTSKNLLDFSYEGEVIPYGDKTTQDHLIGTGSVVRAGELNYFYFTGHNASNSWLQNSNPGWTNSNSREAVMYATSNNLNNWTKKQGFLLKAPQGYSANDFRDPYVFYNTEFSEYWMLISAQKQGKGVILVYKTTNPANDQWLLRGELNVEGDYLMLECADIFKIEDKYYMLFAEDWSGTPGTHYRVASSTAGPWLKPADGRDMFDGYQFYAGRSASNGTDRFAFGWAHRRNSENDNGSKTWAGNLITHQIFKLSNGKLGVKSPAAVNSYFTKETDPVVETQSGMVSNTGGNYVLTGTSAKAMYKFGAISGSTKIKGSLSLGNLTGTAAIGLNTKADNSSYMIRFEPAAQRIAAYNNGEEITRVPFKLEAGKNYNFSIVIDGSVAVLYVNDEVALTNRIYSLQGNAWSLSADNNQLNVGGLKIIKH